jgi:hypothetical protein
MGGKTASERYRWRLSLPRMTILLVDVDNGGGSKRVAYRWQKALLLWPGYVCDWKTTARNDKSTITVLINNLNKAGRHVHADPHRL